MANASLLSPSPEAGATPRELAGHIRAEIARTCGPQLPCYGSEQILNGFLERFSAEEVMAICDRAFGALNGMWRGAPVTVLRFGPDQDDYFARPLLEEARAGARP